MRRIALPGTPTHAAQQAARDDAVAAAGRSLAALLADPAAAVAANDARRRPDAPDPGLHTLEEMQAALRATPGYRWAFPVPTVVPPGWAAGLNAALADTPEACEKRLLARWPALAAVTAVAGAVVAGGAVAGAIAGGPGVGQDADIFITGVDGADESALWRKADEIVRAIRGHYAGDPFACVTTVLQPGVLTLYVHNWRQNAATGHQQWQHHPRALVCGSGDHAKYQIILRAYPSVSALLHAFDVPAACVAYLGGARFVATALGAIAHCCRVNIVVPRYSSTTFPLRLSKYTARGYALGLPHLGATGDAAEVDLGAAGDGYRLRLKVARRQGNCLLGTCEPLAPPGATPAEQFDYFDDGGSLLDIAGRRGCRCCTGGGGRVDSGRLRGWARYAVPGHNLRVLAAGRDNWLIVETAAAGGGHNTANVGGQTWVRRADAEQIDLAKYAREGAPTLEAILPKAKVREYVRSVMANAERLAFKGVVNVSQMLRVLCASPEEVAAMAAAITAHLSDWRSQALRARRTARALARDPDTFIDTSLKLVLGTGGFERYRQRLLRAHAERAATPIAWWIVQDPGRQYTASRNPCVADPADWYGRHYAPAGAPPAPLADSIRPLTAIGGLPADVAGVYGDSCALCLESITAGAPNTTTLPCGHTFHTGGADCGGIIAWCMEEVVRRGEGGLSCPTCRAAAGGRAAAVARRMRGDDDSDSDGDDGGDGNGEGDDTIVASELRIDLRCLAAALPPVPPEADAGADAGDAGDADADGGIIAFASDDDDDDDADDDGDDADGDGDDDDDDD